MKKMIGIQLFVFLSYSIAFSQSADRELPWNLHGKLSVSSDGHSLAYADGSTFFWLGETSWALHQNLSREEVLKYLDNTKAAGFNVIQLMTVNAWALHDWKNYYGDTPYLDDIAAKLNPPYWEHLGWVIDQAANRGIYVLLVFGSPGRTDNHGSVTSTPAEAYAYGNALGKFYARKSNLIWSGGIDVNPDDVKRVSPMGIAGWHAMAEGVTDGVNGVTNFDNKANWNATLMTYHPRGQWISAKDRSVKEGTSSVWFHDAAWLDFNGAQIGLRKDDEPVNTVSSDYSRTPYKPIIDIEPWYEENRKKEPPVNDWEVRIQAYQSVFSGAFGHTYGHNLIYPFDSSDDPNVKTLWRERLSAPGRMQMQFLKKLMTSREFSVYKPLSDFILHNDTQLITEHISAIGGNDGSWACVYTPQGKPFLIKTDFLKSKKMFVQWFKTKTGQFQNFKKVKMKMDQEFTPPGEPGEGNDWVLCITSRKIKDSLLLK